MANYGADGYFGNSPEQQAAQDAAEAQQQAERAQAGLEREQASRLQEGYEPKKRSSGPGGNGGCALLFLLGISLSIVVLIVA